MTRSPSDLHGMGKVARPGGPVHHHRQLARPACSARSRLMSAAAEAGSRMPSAFRLSIRSESLGSSTACRPAACDSSRVPESRIGRGRRRPGLAIARRRKASTSVSASTSVFSSPRAGSAADSRPSAHFERPPRRCGQESPRPAPTPRPACRRRDRSGSRTGPRVSRAMSIRSRLSSPIWSERRLRLPSAVPRRA